MAPKFLDLQISGAARGVVLSAFANALGDGRYLAGAALFFTRGLGIPVAQVGSGSLARVCSVLPVASR